MGIEELKDMKTQIANCVKPQLSNLEKANTHELGEAIDMIKDLSEAIYYCTITEAMEKKDESRQVNNITYYTTPVYNKYPEPMYRDMERNNGYMYYPTGGNSNTGGNVRSSGNSMGMSSPNSNTTSYYTEIPYEMMRDPREGRSAMRRRMYMEGKEQHKDEKSQLRELEAYLEELSNDVAEMIKDSSPEEKATLHQKMTTLANKIV